jgi:hypothetical protein
MDSPSSASSAEPIGAVPRALIALGIAVLAVGCVVVFYGNAPADPPETDSLLPIFEMVAFLSVGFLLIGSALLTFPEIPWKIIGGVLTLTGGVPFLLFLAGLLLYGYEALSRRF